MPPGLTTVSTFAAEAGEKNPNTPVRKTRTTVKIGKSPIILYPRATKAQLLNLSAPTPI